jgi:hypothetical protein
MNKGEGIVDPWDDAWHAWGWDDLEAEQLEGEQ